MAIPDHAANEALEQESAKIDRKDLEAVMAARENVERKARKSSRLNRFLTDIRLMFDMVGDYWKGNYRAVPWLSIAAIAGALLYVFNPLDLIPDMILGVGLMDDAAVIAVCLGVVENDLQAYQDWKHRQEAESQPS
ncbi:YkvA family protein [Marinobacter salicampi]|uniref:YkvA family protein n=1 Tax=Marinobacter salicampi TaxID=435907 RepID=UPI001408726E|nr:YkvA family protein [Marinobacter salicampi]